MKTAEEYTNQEIIVRILAKYATYTSPTLNSEDYGPQRWVRKDRIPTHFDEELGMELRVFDCCDKLEFVENEILDEYDALSDNGHYMCPVCKTVYTKDETVSKMGTHKDSCRKLKPEEVKWMEAHKEMFSRKEYMEYMQETDETIEDDVEKMLEYNDEVFSSYRAQEISDAEYTNDNTEMPYKELLFWRKMVWRIGHDHKGALAICKEHSKDEWFTKEKKEYIWELIKDEETKRWGWIKYLMIRSKAILKQIGANHAPLSPILPNMKEEVIMHTNGIKNVVRRTYVGEYTQELAKKKEFNVHIFYSRNNLKQGFVNYWAMDGNKICGFKRENIFKAYNATDLKNTHVGSNLKKICERAKGKGYTLKVVDVTNACKTKYNKVPLYSRALSMNPEQYAHSTLKDLI